MNFETAHINSPIGTLELVAVSGKLIRLQFTDLPSEEIPTEGIFYEAAGQLQEYFAGKRQTFDFPFEPFGTPFEKKVWGELLNIPFAETITYTQLSVRIGNPLAVRAVGHSIGRNPLLIIIPCHRVIGKGGQMVGFAGGIPRKKFLLDHERNILTPGLFA